MISKDPDTELILYEDFYLTLEDFFNNVNIDSNALNDIELSNINLIAFYTDYSCIETVSYSVPFISKLKSMYPKSIHIFHVGDGNKTSKLINPNIDLETIDFPNDNLRLYLNPSFFVVDKNGLIHNYQYLDVNTSNPDNHFFDKVMSMLDSVN